MASRSRRRTRFRQAALTIFGLERSATVAPLSPVSVSDARRDVMRLVGRLTETKRVALLLHEVDGMSAAEIAELLDCPEATVWSRLRLAWEDLRRFAAEEPHEGGESSR